MAEIVESEVTESCSATQPDETLGHEVRRPRPAAGLVGTEDEAVLEGRHSPVGCCNTVLPSQQRETRGIEGNPIRTPCLGRHYAWTIGSLDQRSLNAKASADKVHVDPAQCQELPSTGSGRGGQGQIEVEGGIPRSKLKQLSHLFRCRRSHLNGLISRWSRLVSDVLKDPRPALRLAQRGMERRVDTPHRTNGQGSTINPAI